MSDKNNILQLTHIFHQTPTPRVKTATPSPAFCSQVVSLKWQTNWHNSQQQSFPNKLLTPSENTSEPIHTLKASHLCLQSQEFLFTFLSFLFYQRMSQVQGVIIYLHETGLESLQLSSSFYFSALLPGLPLEPQSVHCSGRGEQVRPDQNKP